MRWKDYLEKRSHENIMCCQRLLGKPLTLDEQSQVRAQVESIMRLERKESFKQAAQDSPPT